MLEIIPDAYFDNKLNQLPPLLNMGVPLATACAYLEIDPEALEERMHEAGGWEWKVRKAQAAFEVHALQKVWALANEKGGARAALWLLTRLRGEVYGDQPAEQNSRRDVMQALTVFCQKLLAALPEQEHEHVDAALLSCFDELNRRKQADREAHHAATGRSRDGDSRDGDFDPFQEEHDG